MGRGGRSPSPNDDRSRSMNSQDVVGQAAMANEARQRGDDYWDDGYDDDVQSEGIMVTIEPDEDRSHWGVYRDEETAIIKWSGDGDKYIVIYSNGIDVLKILGIPPHGDISMDKIPIIKNILISLGYEVKIRERFEDLFFY